MRRRILTALIVGGTGLAGVSVWAAVTGGAEPLSPALDLSTFEPGAMSSVAGIDSQIAFYDARIADDPRAAADRAALASLYLQRSRETADFADFRKAEELARASLAIRTKSNARAFRILSASLLAQHRFVEAGVVAEELVRIWPEDAAHSALLAEIQMELGQYEEAERTLQRVEGNREDLSVAPRFARLAEVRGRTEEERRILVGAAERASYRNDMNPEQQAWYYLRIAEHDLRNGQLAAAERAYRKGLEIEPNDFRMVAGMARLEAARGEWQRVIDYGRALGDAADLRTMAVVGDAYAQLGQHEQAESWYRKVEAAAAENPEPYNRQWTQFRLDHDRNIPETLALLEEEARERKDVLGQDLLAWALYRAGRYDEAAAASQRALRLGTRDPSFYFHAGVIEHARGNVKDARTYLRTALDINPSFHPSQAAVARAIIRGEDIPDRW